MQIFRDTTSLTECIEQTKKNAKAIGFVPTMGALHQGHLSLIDNAKRQTDFTICSIFVNPTQFNNPEDFRLYPSQIENDLKLLNAALCDAVFIPSPEEIYPEGLNTLPHYELGYLETIMEGKYRPGHFQGVCQVVDRLLQIVNPDLLFLGQKDLQQCKVIERLLEITGKKKDIKLIICSTVREQDGLAMSSRNQRLTEAERKKSVAIFEVLSAFKTAYGNGSFKEIKKQIGQLLEQEGIKLEYLELVNSATLEILTDWPQPEINVSTSVCIAAYLGKIRLIDNMILQSF
jgi:pantoate--beta-alanine ligase